MSLLMVRLLALSLGKLVLANESQTAVRTPAVLITRHISRDWDGNHMGIFLSIYQTNLGLYLSAPASWLSIWRGCTPSSPLLLALFQPGLYFMGETWGVKWTSASEAGRVIALVPVALATMAAYFLKEKLNSKQILSIVASVLGVLVIVSAQGKIQFGEHLWGILALLVAVLVAGAYTILARHSSTKFTPLEITFVMMWAGTIIFNVLGVGQSVFEGTFMAYLRPLHSSSVLWAILYLGAISSVVAFFLSNYMFAALPVPKPHQF